jgi:hypothetical protein
MLAGEACVGNLARKHNSTSWSEFNLAAAEGALVRLRA